ncbi:MAG: hypothetical protein M1830_008236 [Pleopsidium flavum]|nr:MAG: hypothetical protein M1830_008236 [Pleopsidium flavum]
MASERLVSSLEDSGSDQMKEGGALYEARKFDSKEQSRRLLRDQSIGLAVTILLVVLVIVTLKAFQDEGNISKHRKTGFNVIITTLSLALGLNFFEAFKDMAKVYRWRILASGQFSLRETDLILGGESLMKLIRLMVESWKKPVTVFVCLAWIALNLIAQASIAMIGLTYSMDSGTDSNGTIFQPGTICAPKLDCYYGRGGCPIRDEVPQVLAHAYGEIVVGQNCCIYSTTADILNSPQTCYYFCRADQKEYAFRYAEYSPKDKARAYPYLTNRIITASSGDCLEYSVNLTGIVRLDTPDGKGEARRYPYSNDTYSSDITIPSPQLANDATTYVYNGAQKPQIEKQHACGPRCLMMYVMRSPGVITDRRMKLFQCRVHISNVSNATLPEHHLPDRNARLAAASIALQGRYTHPYWNNTTKSYNSTEAWQQYQLYPWGSNWETDGLSAERVGERLSHFAIGSLAAMAHRNPTAQLPGTLPTLAYHLDVTWWGVNALAASIAGVHTLLVLLMVWISIPIAVLDDSNLVVARLLSTLVGRLGGGGSLLDGKEIAHAIQREGDGKGGVGFGVTSDSAGRRVLELGEGLSRIKGSKQKRFPEVKYE